MNAKEAAIRDMIPELKKHNKCFLAFKKELNPIMRRLVKNQIKQQNALNPFHFPSKSSSQLVAHCFFSKSLGTAKLYNYKEYYEKI